MSNTFKRTATIHLGENKNKKRVYLQGAWLASAGFAVGGKITATFEKNKLVIRVDKQGDRKISGKGEVPVIDITGEKLAEALPGADKLTLECDGNVITITPAKVEKKKAGRVLTAIAVSLFAGGGLMDEAAKAANFHTAAAVEMNDKFTEVWERNHDGEVYEQNIEDVDFDRMAERIGEPVGLLTAGRPCEPYSNIRRLDRGGQTKRDKSLPPEAHELGHLDYYVLRAVDALNPHTVVIENVPAYLDAGSGYMVRGVLKAMGYNVDHRVIDPLDYGCLTGRKRGVIVATTFDEVVWPQPVRVGRQMSEIFDLEPHAWFDRSTKKWLFDHWEKQTAKGNGFASQVITGDSPQCGTIRKRYFAQQGDQPVVAHPTQPGVFRWLTLGEVKRLHGVPDAYYLGTSQTTAGEAICQGVVVPVFEQIIRSVTGRRLATSAAA